MLSCLVVSAFLQGIIADNIASFIGSIVGVGNPLSPERTRMLLALRINVLAKGYSGISLETLKKYIAAFNC